MSTLTPEDIQQLNELMYQNSHNYILIQKLLDSQKFIIGRIGHEIRNPLTLVSSTLQLIQKQHPEIRDFAHWSQVLDDVKYMQFLLEDLSAYNNGARIKTAFIHTPDFINHLIESCSAALVGSQIKLTCEIAPDLPVLYGDAIKIREMFLNLFRNAMEAAPSGEIHIRCYYDADNLITEITDNGCGIEASQIPDIFTPFTTYKSNGTGLGLAIVKTIAESHNGSVTVESTPHVRTTFTVRLPIQNRSRHTPYQ